MGYWVYLLRYDVIGYDDAMLGTGHPTASAILAGANRAPDTMASYTRWTMAIYTAIYTDGVAAGLPGARLDPRDYGRT